MQGEGFERLVFQVTEPRPAGCPPGIDHGGDVLGPQTGGCAEVRELAQQGASPGPGQGQCGRAFGLERCWGDDGARGQRVLVLQLLQVRSGAGFVQQRGVQRGQLLQHGARFAGRMGSPLVPCWPGSAPEGRSGQDVAVRLVGITGGTDAAQDRQVGPGGLRPLQGPRRQLVQSSETGQLLCGGGAGRREGPLVGQEGVAAQADRGQGQAPAQGAEAGQGGAGRAEPDVAPMQDPPVSVEDSASAQGQRPAGHGHPPDLTGIQPGTEVHRLGQAWRQIGVGVAWRQGQGGAMPVALNRSTYPVRDSPGIGARADRGCPGSVIAWPCGSVPGGRSGWRRGAGRLRPPPLGRRGGHRAGARWSGWRRPGRRPRAGRW